MKLFSSNSLLINKFLLISLKMLSQIGLINLFCSRYLPQGGYRNSAFVFPFF